MCEYCEEDERGFTKPILEDDEVRVYANINELMVKVNFNESKDAGFFTEYSENINYCPLCGRKLSEVQHEQ